MLKKTKMFAGDPAPFVMELPAYHWPTARQRSPQHVGARLELHQEGRHDHPALHHLRLVHHLLRLGRRSASRCSSEDQIDYSILAAIGGAICLDLCAARLGQLAGDGRFHHRPRCQGEHRRYARHSLRRRRRHGVAAHRRGVHRRSPATPSSCSTCCALRASRPSALSSAR